jgi:hypothetical protein
MMSKTLDEQIRVVKASATRAAREIEKAFGEGFDFEDYDGSWVNQMINQLHSINTYLSVLQNKPKAEDMLPKLKDADQLLTELEIPSSAYRQLYVLSALRESYQLGYTEKLIELADELMKKERYKG